MPRKVVDGPLGGLDLGYFVEFIIVEIKTVLTIVTFARGIIVGLKF